MQLKAIFHHEEFHIWRKIYIDKVRNQYRFHQATSQVPPDVRINNGDEWPLVQLPISKQRRPGTQLLAASVGWEGIHAVDKRKKRIQQCWTIKLNYDIIIVRMSLHVSYRRGSGCWAMITSYIVGYWPSDTSCWSHCLTVVEGRTWGQLLLDAWVQYRSSDVFFLASWAVVKEPESRRRLSSSSLLNRRWAGVTYVTKCIILIERGRNNVTQ